MRTRATLTLRRPARTVAATGHRPGKLGGYGKQAFLALFDLAYAYLKQERERYQLTVISGMALGWDQAVARAAIELDLTLIAAVPFEGQERRWPPQSQIAYRKLLKQADEVTIVSFGGYSPRKMQVRNEWMVDRCDVLMALWDGSDGGTANCVHYAQRVQRPIVNLYDRWSAC